jgi:hypothetical protein
MPYSRLVGIASNDDLDAISVALGAVSPTEAAGAGPLQLPHRTPRKRVDPSPDQSAAPLIDRGIGRDIGRPYCLTSR